MAQNSATLHNYNSEFTQCIEELCNKRDDLKKEILDEEEEKKRIENDIDVLSKKLAKTNEALCTKITTLNEYDRIISENEAAYMKILETSQVLLSAVKKEANQLINSKKK